MNVSTVDSQCNTAVQSSICAAIPRSDIAVPIPPLKQGNAQVARPVKESAELKNKSDHKSSYSRPRKVGSLLAST
jgi:hypothetical protein